MARGSRDLERQQREREWKTQRTGIYLIELNPHLSPTLNPQHSSLLLRHSPRGENAPPRIRYYPGYRRGQSNNGTGFAISTRELKASQWQTALRCFLFQLVGRWRSEDSSFLFFLVSGTGALFKWCHVIPALSNWEKRRGLCRWLDVTGLTLVPGNSRRGWESDGCLVELRFKRLLFQMQCSCIV